MKGYHYVLFLIIIIVALGLVNSNVHYCNNYIEKHIKPQHFRGYILKKYKANNRATPYIVLEQNRSIYLDYSIYEKVRVGDSVIKKSGELRYTVIRNDETLEFYPICDGKEWYK